METFLEGGSAVGLSFGILGDRVLGLAWAEGLRARSLGGEAVTPGSVSGAVPADV